MVTKIGKINKIKKKILIYGINERHKCINIQRICINIHIVRHVNIRHIWQMQQVSVNA